MKNIVVGLLLSLIPLASFAQAQAEVEMIQPAGDQYYNYNFGSTFVNSTKYVDFTVTSTGDEPLQLKELGIAGAAFNAYTNCPDSLPPGQKCTVRARFWPSDKRSYTGRLYLIFAHGRSIINLYGRGI
jgi:hypothetical protein